MEPDIPVAWHAVLADLAGESGEAPILSLRVGIRLSMGWTRDGALLATSSRLLAAWEEAPGIVGHRAWRLGEVTPFRIEEGLDGPVVTFQCPEGEIRLEHFATDEDARRLCRALGIPAGRMGNEALEANHSAVEVDDLELPAPASDGLEPDTQSGGYPASAAPGAQAGAAPTWSGSVDLPPGWSGREAESQAAAGRAASPAAVPPKERIAPVSYFFSGLFVIALGLLAAALWSRLPSLSWTLPGTSVSNPGPEGFKGLRLGMPSFQVRDRLDLMETLVPVARNWRQPGDRASGRPTAAPVPGEHFLWVTTINGQAGECLLSFDTHDRLAEMLCGVYDLTGAERHAAVEDSLLRSLEQACGVPQTVQGAPLDGNLAAPGSQEHDAVWTWTGDERQLRFTSQWSRDLSGLIGSSLEVDLISIEYQAFLMEQP